MVHGVPKQSVQALAERPPVEAEIVHPRVLRKLAELAEKKVQDKKKNIQILLEALRKQQVPVAAEVTPVDLAPSKEKLCWADEE